MENFWTSVISHGDTIIVAIVAIILGWDRLRSGTSNIRKEIAADYKERNQQLEEKIRLNEQEIQKTNLELASLKATIVEKDKHIESLTKLNQDRNPETINLIREIKDGNVAIREFIKTTYQLMEKINSDMGYQTEILERSQQREKKIDIASKQHKGPVLRAPVNGIVEKINKNKKK